MDVHRKVESEYSSPQDSSLSSSLKDLSLVEEFHDEEKDIMKLENKVKVFLLNMWSNSDFCGIYPHCKKYIMNLESKDKKTELLKISKNDADLRNAIVWAITMAGYEDFSILTTEMLMILKEAMEDTDYKIRKDSILNLATLYEKYISSADLSPSDVENLSFIRNHILQAYFLPYIDIRIWVEKFLECSVILKEPIDRRMKVLLNIFCTFDNRTLEAFKEIIKFQCSLRWQMKEILKGILENHKFSKKKYRDPATSLSDKLYDRSRSKRHIKKIFKDIYTNNELCIKMSSILNYNLSYDEAEKEVDLIIKMFGGDKKRYRNVFSSLLSRIIFPLTIDHESIRNLVNLVKDVKDCEIVNKELYQPNLFCKGLELLLILASNFPSLFLDEEVCKIISQFLLVKDEQSITLTIQILSLIINDVKIHLPKINECLQLLEPLTTVQKNRKVFIKDVLIKIKEDLGDDEKLICDIALNIMESNSERIGNVEFPVDPVLSSESFAEPENMDFNV